MGKHFNMLNSSNPVTPTLPSCPVNTMNLHFPNPVGLAAGYDRDGKMINNLNTAGFGFIEIGTVNVNSEVESDDELEVIIRNLDQSKNQSTNQALLGISLGSLRDTIDDHTISDYLHAMDKFWFHADYIVINLSRPGSSMRSEENRNDELRTLLERIKQKHNELCEKLNTPVPIIIKVAIEHKNRAELPETITIAHELGFDGLLAAFENWPSTTEVITTVKQISLLTNNLPLVVVGGIKTADDALKILNAGAKLVQCYTLLAEHGSTEMKKMINNLVLLKR